MSCAEDCTGGCDNCEGVCCECEEDECTRCCWVCNFALFSNASTSNSGYKPQKDKETATESASLEAPPSVTLLRV